MSMEKISEAVLDKVKTEAEDIIRQAQSTAQERLAKAREQQNTRYEEEKTRMIEEAKSEASRIRAQTSISIRQEILKAKNEVIQKIVSGLKSRLADLPDNDELTMNLIKEGTKVIGAIEVIVYVSPGHIDSIKNLVKNDKDLSAVIKDYKETRCTGGAVIEDIESRFRIDNTFDTRIETLLPQILPEISKELFG
ncbi:V-type ATP synthase subunit E [Chloroflexota bacterium]